MKNTRLLKKILLLACVLVMLVNSLSAFAETVGDTGAAEPPAAAEAAAAEDAFAEEPAPAEDTRQEEAEPAPQAEEINASLPESEQFTAQAAPAAADAAPQAQAEDDAIDLQPAESNSAVFGIAVTQSSKLLPFRFSESGRYASILVEGTYKKNQDPSVVKASPQGTGTLTVLEAWQVLNVKNNADLTLTATLDALPDTLGEAETLSFYALMDGRLDSTALQADIDVGDQTALDLAHKGADGIALVKQAADADDLPTDGTVIWANDDVYLTGKMPKNAIVVAEPVPVEVNGEFVLAAYDIRIYNNANKLAKGQTWQPAGDKVQVHFRDKAFKAGDQVNIYHRAAESGAFEKVDTVTAEDAMVTFEAGSFSVYAATVLEKTVEAKNGDIYRITATYDKQSGIPADAELRAAEIEVDNASYERYLRQTADALHVDVRSVAYSRLFDISIVGKDGTVYQPNDAVSVTIELLNADARSVESMRVVHFGSDESEQKGQSVENADAAAKELTAQTNGRAVTFSTDGFSVFSLIDTSVISRVVNAIFGTGNDKLYENDDIILTGNMPLLGTVEASPVTVEIDGQPSLLGYDIKIYANSLMKLLGIAWQPSEGALQVTMKSDNLTVNAVDVYHMETASSAAELVTENIAVSENSVTFDAGKFSVYVIVETKLTETVDASDGNTYEIEVTYKNTSGIPMEGTALLVSELKQGDARYDEYVAASAAKIGTKAENIELSRVFNIQIVDENDHSTVYEPVGDVEVSIRLVGETLNNYANLDVLHFVEDENTEGFTVYDMDSIVDGETVQFTTDSFSVYVVTGYVLETTIDIEGQTYKVTATYDDNAGIPGDAKLKVSEMSTEDEDYLTYLNNTAAALGVSAGELGYLRMFDISIVGNDGTEYKPNDQVTVTVELMDETETGNLRVVHFGDKTQELDAETVGDAVTFTTDSFSLFSFVDLTLIQNVVDAVFGSTYTDKIYENDDIIVSGRMPRTAIVEVNPAEVEIGGQDVLVAYDIKIYAGLITKALGIAWQPTGGALTVQMKSDAIDVENVDVYHMADASSAAELVAESLAVTNHSVTFTADSFSVYALAPETYHRTYRFFTFDANMQYVEYTLYTDIGTTTYTQIIKNGESLVVPQLPSIPGSTTSTFAGWYVGTLTSGSIDNQPIDPANVSLSSTEFDFDNIPAITTNGEEVYLFAKFADFAYVVFHDQYNGTSRSFPVAMTRRGEKINGTATVQISDFSVAYDDNTNENTAPSMAFYGWSYTPITTAGSDTDDEGHAVSKISTDSISITGNVHLYPIFKPIHWLSYYSGPSGSGATYIPSKNYYVGEGPTSLSVPTRSGYAFDGWYTGSVEIIKDGEGHIISENVTYGTKVANADGSLVAGADDTTYGVKVNDGMLLLSKNATLYAKWIEAAANYTVIIWKQASEGAKYEFDHSVPLTATTGSTVSVTNEYKSYSYTGFTYSRCDADKTVEGDGSTVLNVYYDRIVYSLKFFFARTYTSNGYTYIQVNNNNDGFNNTSYSNAASLQTALTLARTSNSNYNDYQRIGGQQNTWKDVAGSTLTDPAAIVSNTYLTHAKSVLGDANAFIGTQSFTGNTTRFGNGGGNATTLTPTFTYYYIQINVRHGQMLAGLWPSAGGDFAAQTISNYNYEYRGTAINPIFWGSMGRGNVDANATADASLVHNSTDKEGYYLLYWRFEATEKALMHIFFEALDGETVDKTEGGVNYVEQDGNDGTQSLTSIVVSGYTDFHDIIMPMYDGFDLVNNIGNNKVTLVNESGTFEGTAYTRSFYAYYQRHRNNLEFSDSYTANPSFATVTHSVPYGEAMTSYIPAKPDSVRNGYQFTGWYADSACSTRVFFEDNAEYQNYSRSKILYTTMPDNGLQFYAGWETIWYKVIIDPNYGWLNNGSGTGSTWFWEPYNGDPIEEYTWVKRDYVEAINGTYFYHYDSRSAHGWGDEWTSAEDADHQRYAYYTTNQGEATDHTRTFRYAENAYRYAGWYEVNQTTGEETLYNFGEPVTHDTYLILHWKKIGTYHVQYNAVVTQDGQTLSGTIDGGDSNEALFFELDGDHYADNATVVVGRTANAPEGYNFVGWTIRGDSSGTVYYPGQSFVFLSKYALTMPQGETIFLDAVYTRVGTAKIIYNANGGTIDPTTLDYGYPTDASAPVPATSYNLTAGTATIENLINNSEIRLSSGEGFSMTNATLVGWSTSSAYDPSTDTLFALGDTSASPVPTYYVDTEDPVTLYAVWEVKVYFHLNESTSNANFGGTWDSSVYTLKAADLYSRTVYVNNPVNIPAYTPVFYNSNNPDNLFFHYWGTMRYAGDNITEYDFSQPVTGELHLYAYWAGPIKVPVHAVDASASTLVDKDNPWLTNQPQTMIEVAAAEVSLATKANAAVFAANVPSGYAFAFAAVKSRTADLQTISEDQAITALFYNSTAKKVYVRYTDGTEAPMADEDEVYLVYYKDPLTLNIAYKVMNTSGGLSDATMGRSGFPTSGSAGTYAMDSSVSRPLYWANQSSYKYYAYAIGAPGATSASQLQLITASSNSDNSRPQLRIKNTWRGYQYSTDGGTTWVSCGYDGTIQLYVVYFETDSQPTVVTINEKTIGTQADMSEEFEYVVNIVTTTTTTISQERRSRTWRYSSWGNWGSYSNYGTPQISSETEANSSTFTLSDGEQKSETAFYTSTSTSEEGSVTTSGNTQYQVRTTTTIVTTQTITVVQTAKSGFTTSNAATAGTSTQPYTWTYTTTSTAETPSVTYTNIHTLLPVEVHVALVGGSGITLDDNERASAHTITLDIDRPTDAANIKTFLTELPAATLFTGDDTTYGFAGIVYGTSGTTQGDAVTVVGTDVSSIIYQQMYPSDASRDNIYELTLLDSASATLDQLGSYKVYYLYYPLPKVQYVKESEGGTLTPVIANSANPLNSGNTITLNGVTVTQNQMLPVTASVFTITQSTAGTATNNYFNMPLVLDDTTVSPAVQNYLRYTKLGAGDAGVTNTSQLSTTDALTMQLKVDGSQIKWSFDGTTWNTFSGAPTIYAIYTEIGYDLHLTKTVTGDAAGVSKTFTLLVSSAAITRSSYAVTGTGYPTVTATPSSGSTPGTISLTIQDGSDITISGLGRGSYTITESDNSNYTLTASLNGSDVTVVDNQYINSLTLDGNKALALTNTRKTQTVTITKTLVDPVVNSATFAFTGALMDGSTDITSQISGLSSFSITANTSAGTNTYTGTATFTLPVGAVLTVTEDMTAEQTELYEGTVTPTGGSLTVSETAAENVLNFTNTRKSARLTITKNVTGDMGDRSSTNQFTFTLVSVADETSGTTYAWTKTAAGGTTTSGMLTTASGSNTFTLAHGESIVIELPLNKAVVISENNGLYKPTWSTSDSTVTLANTSTATVTATLTNDASVTIENNLPAVAPTGLSFAYAPFLLMAAAGIMLGLIGRRKRRQEE